MYDLDGEFGGGTLDVHFVGNDPYVKIADVAQRFLDAATVLSQFDDNQLQWYSLVYQAMAEIFDNLRANEILRRASLN